MIKIKLTPSEGVMLPLVYFPSDPPTGTTLYVSGTGIGVLAFPCYSFS